MKKSAVLIVFTGVICLGMSAFREKPEPIAQVNTTTVLSTDVTMSVTASGTLEPYRTRTLGVAGYGVAERVYLNVGDSVREGQVIATFSGLESPAVDVDPGDLLDSVDADSLLSGDAAAAVSGAVAQALSVDQLVTPFDGVLTALNIAEGEQASPLEVIAEVSDFSRVRARVKMDEDSFTSVAVGMPAEVESGGIKYDAVVIEVSPLVRTSLSLTGSSERYGEAVLELYDPAGALVGSSASAEIFTERRSGVMTLPFEAVDQDELNREFVYVMDGGRARLCYVTTGAEIGGSVEVLGGVRAGDEVIVTSTAPLSNGDDVEVAQ